MELVKNGLAVARFSPEDGKFKEEISKAEREARKKKIGCQWSGKVEENQEEKKQWQWKKLTPDATGLKIVKACQAENYNNKEVIVEGFVAEGHRSRKNNVFLNFQNPYPNQCFSAVIFYSDLYKFVQNPENFYEKKIVRVKGKIQQYQGKPEIILKDPSQIEVGK